MFRHDPFVERVAGVEQQRQLACAIDLKPHFGEDLEDYKWEYLVSEHVPRVGTASHATARNGSSWE